jgi:hypothetical protein
VAQYVETERVRRGRESAPARRWEAHLYPI